MQNTALDGTGCSVQSSQCRLSLKLGKLLRTMAITKQEFYEGAALHKLARSGNVTSLKYEPPLFIVNGSLLVCLKYSTHNRTPWGFTFTGDEQTLLRTRARKSPLVIALVCGSDGVAAITYSHFRQIASPKKKAIHIACYRKHGEHYAV